MKGSSIALNKGFLVHPSCSHFEMGGAPSKYFPHTDKNSLMRSALASYLPSDSFKHQISLGMIMSLSYHAQCDFANLPHGPVNVLPGRLDTSF